MHGWIFSLADGRLQELESGYGDAATCRRRTRAGRDGSRAPADAYPAAPYANEITPTMKLNERLSTLPRDIVAGIVVFLVALPLCLGIANASGVEPFAGLVSGIVGGIVVALLSGSSLSVSGPAAGLVVIVVEGIAQLGSFSAFLLAVLLSGAMQFGFGMLQAGRFAAYVPSPVIKGMLAAIGLLLIVKQIPVCVRHRRLGCAIVCIVAGPAGRFVRSRPRHRLASLALLIAGKCRCCAASRWCAGARAARGRRPGHRRHVRAGHRCAVGRAGRGPSRDAARARSFAAFAASLERAELGPNFAQLVNPDVWRVAITLAVVASLETLLSLEAVEQIDPERRPTRPIAN